MDGNKLEITGNLFIGNDSELYIDVNKEIVSVSEEIYEKLNICNTINSKPKIKLTIEILER